MSGWYWVLWAVVTVVNVYLVLATGRNLRQTERLVSRVRAYLGTADP